MTLQPIDQPYIFSESDMARFQKVCQGGDGDLIIFSIPLYVEAAPVDPSLNLPHQTIPYPRFIALHWLSDDTAGTVSTGSGNGWTVLGTWHHARFTADDAKNLVGGKEATIHTLIDNGCRWALANPA